MAFSVHDLTKCQLAELESLSHSYLKRWLGLPRGASWALVHDVHGMGIKSVDHLSHSLTLSRIRFFSDGRVRHALDCKEERESRWCRKFSTANYAKGLIEEVVPPIRQNPVLTVGQAWIIPRIVGRLWNWMSLLLHPLLEGLTVNC